MRNMIRTYTGGSLQISFLIIAMLFNTVANAQRLNEDGLKMISRIRIAQKDTIYFKLLYPLLIDYQYFAVKKVEKWIYGFH